MCQNEDNAMKQKTPVITIFKTLFLTLLLTTLVIGCRTANNGEPDVETPEVTIVTEPAPSQPVDPDSGYPSPSDVTSAYPGQSAPTPEGALSEMPDPERNLPAPDADSGSVGGFLIRVESGTYIPVMPQKLYLAKVLLDNQGRQSVIARNANSQQAELLPAGVFLFTNVPPGTYGLVLDIALAEFPALAENGQPLLIEVEAGQSLDLGAVVVELP
jgi:hypothetical protein